MTALSGECLTTSRAGFSPPGTDRNVCATVTPVFLPVKGACLKPALLLGYGATSPLRTA
jgi:hypothetical protein